MSRAERTRILRGSAVRAPNSRRARLIDRLSPTAHADDCGVGGGASRGVSMVTTKANKARLAAVYLVVPKKGGKKREGHSKRPRLTVPTTPRTKTDSTRDDPRRPELRTYGNRIYGVWRFCRSAVDEDGRFVQTPIDERIFCISRFQRARRYFFHPFARTGFFMRTVGERPPNFHANTRKTIS